MAVPVRSGQIDDPLPAKNLGTLAVTKDSRNLAQDPCGIAVAAEPPVGLPDCLRTVLPGRVFDHVKTVFACGGIYAVGVLGWA